MLIIDYEKGKAINTAMIVTVDSWWDQRYIQGSNPAERDFEDIDPGKPFTACEPPVLVVKIEWAVPEIKHHEFSSYYSSELASTTFRGNNAVAILTGLGLEFPDKEHVEVYKPARRPSVDE